MTKSVAVLSPFGQLIRVTRHVGNINRTWVLNDIGTAHIEIPTSAPNFTQITSWGNIFVIYDKYLPPWIGVVETCTTENGLWSADLKSAEYLMKDRLTQQSLVIGAQNGGMFTHAIVQKLFTSAMALGWTPLTLGVLGSIKKHFKEYEYADLFEAIQALAQEDEAVFWVDDKLKLNFVNAVDEGNRLTLFEHRDISEVAFSENITEVATAVIAFGEGADVLRKPKRIYSAPSDKFFRVKKYDVKGAKTANQLDTPAKEFIQKNYDPRVAIDGNIINRNGLWGRLSVGQTINLVVYGKGAGVYTAKIIGLQSNDTQLRAVFEVIQLSPVQPLVVNPPPSYLAGAI